MTATTTTREQYAEEAKERLDGWTAQLDELESRLGRAREASHDELERELRRTREVHAAASARLDELVRAGSGAADRVRQETEHFMTVLERSIRHFRSQL